MAKIQKLTTSVITKIAAGEVIERPASVVKELLDNCIDAGSTRIDLDVEKGGAELIRVVDNGCGMSLDDLPLAFASHATSKLREAEDLFRVGTMGFRGEALASIGGVSHAIIQARPHDQEIGGEISCQGGVISQAKSWNGAKGTRIEIRQLFYNTPVRRKFLKSTGTEMGHICEIFTRLALSQPNLHLRLTHNGKLVYEIPGSTDLLERITLFFGQEISDGLYPVSMEHKNARLHGFIGDPALNRGNSKMQYLFLNRRWIRDRSLSHAMAEAYRGLLMTGRFPVTFLFLEMPPDMVDVNVHPTKSEVRFREGQFLYSMFLRTIRDRLTAENLTHRLQVPSTLKSPVTVGNPSASNFNQLNFPQPSPAPLPDHIFAPAAPSATPQFTQRSDMPPPASPPFAAESLEKPANESPFPEDASSMASAFASATTTNTNTENTKSPSNSANDFKAIQLYNAYLVLETPEGMLVIDQHALHERILFEKLKLRMKEGALEAQRMLIPEPVDCRAEQAALALEHKDALAELGLIIEDFGNGTLLIQSYPAILGNRAPAEIFQLVLDHLCAEDRLPSREALLNDLLSLMACHSAVRAGDPLTPDQISALVSQRELVDDVHHCPHGRPTALLFSKQDLDKQFGRI